MSSSSKNWTSSAISEHVVSRLGRRRSGKRSEMTNVAATREIVEHMNLMPFLRQLPIVHVAGTKGKGTTSNYVAQLLQRHHFAGDSSKAVALFTSPHLVDVRERIRINGRLVEANQFVSLFDRFEAEYNTACAHVFDDLAALEPQKSNNGNGSGSSTGAGLLIQDRYNFFRAFFVFSVFLMRHFAVSAAVVEVGIGGRLDPTAILPAPRCCVVTALGMDHTDLLGDCIKGIATEKAGIFKPSAVCLSAPQFDFPETRAVLQQHAANVGRVLQFPVPSDFPERSHTTSTAASSSVFAEIARLRGDHMSENAALAVAAARIAAAVADPSTQKGEDVWRGPLTDSEREVLLTSEMEGRSEREQWRSMEVLLDGAHTVESIRRALAWAFSQKQQHKITIIFSTSRAPGPQIEEIQRYADRIERVIFCNIPEVGSARNAGEKCAAAWKSQSSKKCNNSNSIPVDIVDTPASALELAATHRSSNSSNATTVFVLGSMYTVGGALAHMRSKQPWTKPLT